MKQRILLFLFLLLPGLSFAQKHVITRPTSTSKPTTEQKAKPKRKPQSKPKKQAQPAKPQTQQPQPEPQEPAMSAAERQSAISDIVNNMVYVAGGTFTMGATSEQGDNAYSDEKPAHQVTVSSFSIGRYEVTQRQWKAVMGNNPAWTKGDNLPVENVSWDDCQEFISRLNQLTGRSFRLPTEAEWEFAARGGNSGHRYKYAGSDNPDNVGWYNQQSAQPVGSKQPNELGLYDMSGNVYEWCQDWYGPYSSSTQTNPRGAASGTEHVARGGGWRFSSNGCRVTIRANFSPTTRNEGYGLRLAL